jgi:hypothetical protein
MSMTVLTVLAMAIMCVVVISVRFMVKFTYALLVVGIGLIRHPKTSNLRLL